jgi:hypothetical protein
MTVLVVRVLKQKWLRVCDFVFGHWVKAGFAFVSPCRPMATPNVIVPETLPYSVADAWSRIPPVIGYSSGLARAFYDTFSTKDHFHAVILLTSQAPSTPKRVSSFSPIAHSSMVPARPQKA